jgi:hypothetical protein
MPSKEEQKKFIYGLANERQLDTSSSSYRNLLEYVDSEGKDLSAFQDIQTGVAMKEPSAVTALAFLLSCGYKEAGDFVRTLEKKETDFLENGLADIARNSKNAEVGKMAVVALKDMGEKNELIMIARDSSNTDIRKMVVEALVDMDAKGELGYVAEYSSNTEVGKMAVGALKTMDAKDKLGYVARYSSNAETRKMAVGALEKLKEKGTSHAEKLTQKRSDSPSSGRAK